jgi:hypothetical protein
VVGEGPLQLVGLDGIFPGGFLTLDLARGGGGVSGQGPHCQDQAGGGVERLCLEVPAGVIKRDLFVVVLPGVVRF